jgi:hypothetical protein
MKRTQRPTLLLINGIVLGVIATAQFVLDFVAYWTGFGPTGPTLHQNPDTLGYAEAHGLAAILALLFIIRRHDGFAGWHLVAAATHLLLAACNLIFWNLFVNAGLVPLGIAATTMHAIFVVLELGAWFGPRASARS